MAFQRLKALVHRIHVWNLAGKELLISEWSNVNQVIQAVQELQAFEQLEKNKSEPTEFPDDVKPDMLDNGDPEKVFIQIRSTLTQCSSGNGHGSNLEYLLREPAWHVLTTPTVAQEMTANLPLRVLIYESDNSRLFTFLEKFCINHTSWTTIKKFKASLDGRGAYLALRKLYQGEDHVQSKINVEKQRISEGDVGLKYTGETHFKFVNYASSLLAAYEYIGQHRETYSERTKVERLLQGFKGEARDNTTLHWARMHVKDNPSLNGDYEAAVAYLATKVQEAYPSVAGKVPPTRSVNETNKEPNGRDGGERAETNQDRERGVTNRGSHRGGGRGHTHGRGAWGGRGAQYNSIRDDPNGKYNGKTAHKEVNGVDTSDDRVFGSFKEDEFNDYDVRLYVLNRRLFLKEQREGNSNKDQQREDRSGPSEQQIKAVAMEVAKTMMKNKRMWEDDHDTQPEKKQKDPWNLMGKAGER